MYVLLLGKNELSDAFLGNFSFIMSYLKGSMRGELEVVTVRIKKKGDLGNREKKVVFKLIETIIIQY